ncbi:MAG: hypothetical protein GY862_32920 [Gammaproteobacteria bacterium]|nr:hypothetical protein [Gammaproteobacteria bacterium]
MKILKFSGKFFLLAALLGLIALAVELGLLLWPDQELDPIAAAWLEPKQPAFPVEQNSFFSLLGFHAPADTDPHARGMARAEAWTQAASAYRDSGAEPDYDAVEQAFPNEPFPEDAGLENLCKVTEQACLDWYTEHAAEVASLSQTYALWLERYLALYQKPHYHNQTLPYVQTPVPRFSTALKIQELRHAQLGAAYAAGEAKAALNGLTEDFAYARALLTEGDDLIAKMAALKMVANAVHLYSQFLDDASPALFQTVAELAPLSAAERDMQEVMRYEFQGIAILYLAQARQNAFAETPLGEDAPSKPWYQNFVFKPHATINIGIPAYAQAAEFGKLSPAALLESSLTSGKNMPWWNWGYNPLGAILQSIAIPSYTDYALRLQALDGLLNLLKLKAKFRAEGGQTADLAEFLKARGAAYPGLFADQPVQWNAQRKVLFYPVPAAVTELLQPIYRAIRAD